MEKVFVAQRLAKRLWKTEETVDAALAEAATLMSDIIQGRKDLQVSSIFASEIDVKLMAAVQALTEARTAMVGVHNEMSEAQLRLGIRTRLGILPKFNTTGSAVADEQPTANVG